MTPYLLALTLAAAPIQPPADRFSGDWKVRNEIAGNVSEMTCSIALKGSDLSGSCGADAGKFEISGAVDGANIVWVGRTTHEGNPLTLRYTGAVNEERTMAGTVVVEEYNVSGEFKATAVKK